MIYKINDKRKNFNKSIMIPLAVSQGQKLRIDFSEKNFVFLEDLKIDINKPITDN